MRKIRFLASPFLVTLFLLSSCTIDLSQPAAGGTSPTSNAAELTPVPTARVEMETFTPTVAAAAPAFPSNLPMTRIPITWSSLKLSGKLVFLSAVQKETNPILSVQELDLASGDQATIFTGPPLSWIYSLAVSPDGKQLVLCYTAPAANGSQPSQTLYQMPMNGSTPPQVLIPSAAPEDQYLQPEWSPDGKYLYYSHVNYKSVTKTQHYPTFEIYRMAVAGGAPEKIADQAFWPRVSRDGARIVYITSDINTGKNKIMVADPDGKNAQPVAMSGAVAPDIIDAPIFSADGKTILFSAPIPAKSSAPTWLDRVLGITVAEAHTVPSEWWSVPAAGGAVTQLTNLQFAGLFASLAPDAKHLASYSASGLFVMNPDASEVTMIINDLGGIYGTVNWLH